MLTTFRDKILGKFRISPCGLAGDGYLQYLADVLRIELTSKDPLGEVGYWASGEEAGVVADLCIENCHGVRSGLIFLRLSQRSRPSSRPGRAR